MKAMRIRSAALLAALAFLAGPALADESLSGHAIRESIQASGHASAAVAHGLAASGRAVVGVSAVPLAIGGSVLGSAGGLSAAAAGESARAANAPIGTPLEITDETITVMPPNEALKARQPPVAN
jgi:hypothetical protein